ncbi:MAG: tRNA pseudouridine(13) synthase TruD [Pseudomonadota bacterium]|nr:tRNA pseudouridine(13) synthase TruD [Pseudomonadota bacterium]
MSALDSGLARAHGEEVLDAVIRSRPEDFRVEEIASFEPSGSGEHLLLTVEKRGMNTGFAAKRLAQWAGVPEMAIGYAGMKDRHAVTRQRFSVHLPKRVAPDLAELQIHADPDAPTDAARGEQLRVLEHHWHSRKLPRGALSGNRFVLVLRDAVGSRELIESRLRAIAAHGVPNYFGEQRFGRDGDNIANARAMFAGRRVRREQRGMLLSAARSQLFNRVLSARVQAENWSGLQQDKGLEGEVWTLDGSRSVFGPEPFTDALAQRLADFDIHPSGPLWGRGELRSTGQVAAMELEAVADEESVVLRAGLEQAGLDHERRSLRLRPTDLSWQWLDASSLELSFTLPPGAYATVVLAELGDLREASHRG